MNKFTIKNVETYGLLNSVRASGNPMRVEIETFDELEGGGIKEFNEDQLYYVNEKRKNKAKSLANTPIGQGHDQFLTGCIVQFDLYAPLYMWKQIQRYHFLDFISSQSTMHRLKGFDIASCCTEEVDSIIIQRYQEIIDEYRRLSDDLDKINKKKGATGKERKIQEEKTKKVWRQAVASLPCGFVLGATMTTNYRQLKTIYQQRKDHKLKEWHEFCDWIKTLPHSELITGENKIGENDKTTNIHCSNNKGIICDTYKGNVNIIIKNKKEN